MAPQQRQVLSRFVRFQAIVDDFMRSLPATRVPKAELEEAFKEGSRQAFDLVRDKIKDELTSQDQTAFRSFRESGGTTCVAPIHPLFCRREPPGVIMGVAFAWHGRVAGVWTSPWRGRLRLDILRPGALYRLDCVIYSRPAPLDGGPWWFHVMSSPYVRSGYVNAPWVATGAADVRRLGLPACRV
jgi:hypothetical protein